MSHHNNRADASSGNTKDSGRQLHKDWRVWLGVILMLGAMAIYVCHWTIQSYRDSSGNDRNRIWVDFMAISDI